MISDYFFAMILSEHTSLCDNTSSLVMCEPVYFVDNNLIKLGLIDNPLSKIG
jgi:hypothetical protein